MAWLNGKKTYIVAILLALVFSAMGFAAEDMAALPTATSGLLSLFLNALASAAGVTVIATILAWLLKRLFLAKPEWKAVYDEYKPAFISAVKYAEKLIPDNTPNAGLRRLDVALQKVVEIDAALTAVPSSVLAQVMNMVHAEAEAAGNI